MTLAGMQTSLKGFETDLEKVLQTLDDNKYSSRLWARDPELWKTEEEQKKVISNSLGWLDSPVKIRDCLQELLEFAQNLRSSGFRHVLHMGMGGSSLAPLVFWETFGAGKAGLPVAVLDSTDPATVLRLDKSLPLRETFFIEASKSGSTVESRSFGEYFYARLSAIKGTSAGENFAVITDPGSMLERLANERSYRKIFLNYSDIGGRYSALSFFGLVPAVLMGIDVTELLNRVDKMMAACGREVPLSENPGAVLGAIMGCMTLKGRNKLTFLIPSAIASLGMWLEQLIAESTGKEGKGIVPVAGEQPGGTEVYGEDRLFVEFRVENEKDNALEGRAEALRAAGMPVVTISLRDRIDVGAQFLLWEIATATAGAVLRINPFDQPNVQETKSFTGKILEEVRKEGKVPEARMEMTEGPLRLYLAGGASSVQQALSMFFGQAGTGDYLVVPAYLTESGAVEAGLQSLRNLIRDRLGIATTVGYGPRYLHSTGQLHKGGPNTGLFILLTADVAEDTVIPGQPYTFGMLMRAQALGDFEALRKQRRRVIRIHLAGEVPKGLAALEDTIFRSVTARK